MFSYIKKIDDPARFAAIKSGITREDELPADEQVKLATWINALKEAHPFRGRENQLDWVIRHLTDIVTYINAAYANDNTRRSHLNALANVVLGIDKKSAVYVGLARLLFTEVNKLGAKVNAATQDNKATPEFLKNYVPYSVLVTVRDALAANGATSHAARMRYLILCLATYIPPLRLDWLEMKIIPARKSPPEDGANYLWAYAPGKYAIVINNDKIEGRRKAAGMARQITRLDYELEGVTEGDKLNGIIAESLKAEPRDYVLTNQDGSPMSPSTYNLLLSQLFEPRAPTQNMLRKAYINHWYADERKLTEAQLKQIADRMRHTKETARSSYRKVDAPVGLQAIVLPIDRKGHHREASQKYRVAHPEKIARTKIISAINSSGRIPKEITISKHKLYQGTDGRWRSSLDD